MDVLFVSKNKKLFQGKAKSAAVPGFSGMAEILDGHADMVLLLKKGNVSINSASGVKNYGIEGGFCRVNENKLSIVVSEIKSLTLDTKLTQKPL